MGGIEVKDCMCGLSLGKPESQSTHYACLHLAFNSCMKEYNGIWRTISSSEGVYPAAKCSMSFQDMECAIGE